MASPPMECKETKTLPLARRILTPIAETIFESDNPIVAETFHSDADLKVLVKTPDSDPTIYMVCSSALSCASREWRYMLYRNASHLDHSGSEKRQDDASTVTLEGDAKAMATIFRIVHYDFAHVPTTPTLNEVYELAKTACKYKCTHIFNPWAVRWLSSLRDYPFKHFSSSECLQDLFIGWVFGDLQLYRDSVDALVLSSKLNKDGKISTWSGHPLERALMPPHVLEIITDVRATTLTKILGAIKAPINAILFKTSESETSFCQAETSKEACETMLLGSAIADLTKLKLYPVPEPKTFTGSIKDLQRNIRNVRSLPYSVSDGHGKHSEPFLTHHMCGLRFEEAVNTCISEMVVPLSYSIMSWISSQADACGIEANEELKMWRLMSGSPSKRAKESSATLVEDEEGADGKDGGTFDTKMPEKTDRG